MSGSTYNNMKQVYTVNGEQSSCINAVEQTEDSGLMFSRDSCQCAPQRLRHLTRCVTVQTLNRRGHSVVLYSSSQRFMDTFPFTFSSLRFITSSVNPLAVSEQKRFKCDEFEFF